jgi:hypothetical protein
MDRKRELKSFFKDVKRFSTITFSLIFIAKSQSNQTKTTQNLKKLGGGKVKLPYKMLQGMRAKSVDRFKQQKEMDKKLGILADTSRGEKKVMQGYFEMKHHEHAEAKRLNKDTERGMNLYVNSAAKYRDGALTISK